MMESWYRWWGTELSITRGPLFIFMHRTMRMECRRIQSGFRSERSGRADWEHSLATSSSGECFEPEIVDTWDSAAAHWRTLSVWMIGRSLPTLDMLSPRSRERAVALGEAEWHGSRRDGLDHIDPLKGSNEGAQKVMGPMELAFQEWSLAASARNPGWIVIDRFLSRAIWEDQILSIMVFDSVPGGANYLLTTQLAGNELRSSGQECVRRALRRDAFVMLLLQEPLNMREVFGEYVLSA